MTMRKVQERPGLPQARPRTLFGLVAAFGTLILQLVNIFSEYGYAINQLIGKTDSVFDDYLFSGMAVLKGASAPDLETFRDGIAMNAFAGTGGVTEQAFFSVHILHGITAGTTPTFHVHWTHNEAVPSGAVKWQIEYTIARGYGAGLFGSSVTLSSTQTAPAQYVMELTDDDDMPISDISQIEPDAVLVCRIFRDPNDAADTFTGDAFLVNVDLHYEVDKAGTPERNRPFADFA